MSIEVNNLSKMYGQQKAVDAISFRVDKGEIVGFLGPNGAGKSTTMKIITGFLTQDTGEAVVCGINVKEQPLETKRRIGYLPEANPLYFEMYVREYLDFIADIHAVTNKKQRIGEVIQMVGLTVESKKKIGQLSKGYKQRVGLAAALIHDPEVLILDEPTTGLDPNQIIEIREVIRSLGKQKTVLFSSHILQEVEAVCDRVVIINQGKLVANDTIAALRGNMDQSRYIKVSFQEKVPLELIKKLSGVVRINPIDDHNWELQTTAPEALRKQLMELSLQENLNIVSLQSGEQSLEELFRELTKV
ncbi:MAG: gliding motility-associated ABC transporter ATP-binding subunit GldA [Chitinophagaceae bacterium]|nr:MAG: gliding motility-associated ABC transporter ATP-binding subunit GldA [Chitinophagaceae bacterium]